MHEISPKLLKSLHLKGFFKFADSQAIHPRFTIRFGRADSDSHYYGIGGVVHCSFGDVKFFFLVHKGAYTNNLMEAQAILYVVEQCFLRGWSKVICESDSQVVVNLLSS